MTRRRFTETQGGRAWLAAALTVCAALPGSGRAEPLPIDARVVWAHADRIYVAAPESLGLAPGDLLTFLHRKKNVATGEVVQVPARDLASARLTSGSLARVSRLDRVRVLAERPPMRARPLLRVGFPGRGRASLLLECTSPAVRPPPAAGDYRTDSLAENEVRLLRVGAPERASPWPDTILAQLFAEVADEEIALERGELDLAVFWPGEASAHLRADARWRDAPYGARSGAVLAAISPAAAGAEPPLSPDHPALEALNQELFRGDLAPWRDAGTHPPSPPPAGPPSSDMRFEVDASCPGRPALERFLNRAVPGTAAQGRPAARLACLATQVLADSLRVAPLFRMRCLLACEPRLRAYVAALGPDALADLLHCGAADRAP